LVQRIWERCIQAPGVQEHLATVDAQSPAFDKSLGGEGDKWVFSRWNDEMQVYKYGVGHYFKSASLNVVLKRVYGTNKSLGHYDEPYVTASGTEASFYTLQVYLNGVVKGGATRFHSADMERWVDVDAKMGRVLIFQHTDLVHSGAEVLSGEKYTVKTECMYRRVDDISE
jgi:hypothetical protein